MVAGHCYAGQYRKSHSSSIFSSGSRPSNRTSAASKQITDRVASQAIPQIVRISVQDAEYLKKRSQAENSYFEAAKAMKERFVRRLGKMRISGKFCDIEIKVGEHTFPAHRALLALIPDYLEWAGILLDRSVPKEEIQAKNGTPEEHERILKALYTFDSELLKPQESETPKFREVRNKVALTLINDQLEAKLLKRIPGEVKPRYADFLIAATDGEAEPLFMHRFIVSAASKALDRIVDSNYSESKVQQFSVGSSRVTRLFQRALLPMLTLDKNNHSAEDLLECISLGDAWDLPHFSLWAALQILKKVPTAEESRYIQENIAYLDKYEFVKELLGISSESKIVDMDLNDFKIANIHPGNFAAVYFKAKERSQHSICREINLWVHGHEDEITAALCSFNVDLIQRAAVAVDAKELAETCRKFTQSRLLI